jgi:hypothetical protein
VAGRKILKTALRTREGVFMAGHIKVCRAADNCARKIVFVLFLLFVTGFVYSVDEYNITEGIKMYNGNLVEIPSKITYYPSTIDFQGIKNPVCLYFQDMIVYTFFLGDDDYGRKAQFIEVIDKCIEWADVAKKNGVHNFNRSVGTDAIPYNTNLVPKPDIFFVDYIFSIRQTNGREEVILVINYKTRDQQFGNRPGSYLIFKQPDFAALKRIFSSDYLARYDRQAAEAAAEAAEKEKLFR